MSTALALLRWVRPGAGAFSWHFGLAGLGLALAGWVGVPHDACATDLAYPQKAITLVVPFASGGGTDALARLLGTQLQQVLGQAVVVDNRPGANGTVAWRSVQRQPADGYTLLLGSHSTHVIAPLAAQPPQNPQAVMAQFAMVSIVGHAPLVLAVRADAKERDLGAFVQRAKAPGLSYGSFGVGSSGHVMGEVLADAAHLQWVHVPYKGSAPALTDLLGGHLDSVFLTVSAISGGVESAQVRPLAVTGTRRFPSLPSTPTFVELGWPQMAESGWFALFAPAGTPPVIQETLAKALHQVLQSAELRSRLLAQGVDPVGSTPEQARRIWAEAFRQAEPVVKRAHIEFP